jgi:serine/threonine protein kinase
MADTLIGQEVDNGEYRILERLGVGGMGSVYKAEQPAMNRLVAIKVLHPRYANRNDLVSRFRREARAMSQLQHPNTARVYKFGQLADGAPYFVMDYLEGKNLAHVVRAEGPMKPERAIPIMVQVCGALDEAHVAGIIHRDLKPENVFLTKQGGSEDYPKVLDFGLAKVSEKQMGRGSMMLTQQGMVFGTPEFMSPEQTQGEPLDRRSDIYSLALILYELLTGKLPFDATKPIDIMRAHLQDKPIPLNERVDGLHFPDALQAAIDKALAKKPDGRFATAREFADALRASLGVADVMRGAASPSSPPAPRLEFGDSPVQRGTEAPVVPRDRGPMMMLGLILVLIVLAIGAWLGKSL